MGCPSLTISAAASLPPSTWLGVRVRVRDRVRAVRGRVGARVRPCRRPPVPWPSDAPRGCRSPG
eukprot:scaffold11048_cov18-Phaeocystis_antarctica.AAC.1